MRLFGLEAGLTGSAGVAGDEAEFGFGGNGVDDGEDGDSFVVGELAEPTGPSSARRCRMRCGMSRDSTNWSLMVRAALRGVDGALEPFACEYLVAPVG
jgi:hypothetical protein